MTFWLFLMANYQGTLVWSEIWEGLSKYFGGMLEILRKFSVKFKNFLRKIL